MSPKEFREYNTERKKTWRANLSEEGREEEKRKYKKWYIKHHYGITLEEMHLKIEEQRGYCANPFCDVKLLEKAETTKQLIHVDLDHITGEVRGIMCRPCNTDLGRIEKDPLRMKGLLQLAEKYQNIREEFLKGKK